MSRTAGRTDYDKWSRVTKTLVDEAEDDDRREREAASESLGQTRVSYSAAEEEERIKAAAAKKAKAALDRFRQTESNGVATIEGALRSSSSENAEDSNTERCYEVTGDVLGGRRVISLRDDRGPGVVTLPAALSELTSTSPSEGVCVSGVVKVFVEDCHDCTIRLECKIVTSTVEIANCTNLRVEVSKARVSTFQIDLCDGVELVFADDQCFGADEKDRVYHAGVSNLTVRIMKGNETKLTTSADYLADGAVARLNATAEEYQFVTSVVDGALTTKHLERIGEKTTTETTSRRDFLKDTVERCAKRKEEGNEAFRAGEYAQAVLFYTMSADDSDGLEESVREHNEAVEARKKDDGDDAETIVPFTERHAVLANRAACFLKLGHHDKALADAEACLAIKPDHTKALFRKGLALHATGRYREAIDALAAAQRAEPKNKQIAQALRFAEVKLTTEMRKRMEG